MEKRSAAREAVEEAYGAHLAAQRAAGADGADGGDGGDGAWPAQSEPSSVTAAPPPTVRGRKRLHELLALAQPEQLQRHCADAEQSAAVRKQAQPAERRW